MERKKARNFEPWLTSEHFLLHQLHGLSFQCLFFPRAHRHTLDRVRLMLRIGYRNFSFHHAIRFRPVERIATRSLPHSKRLDNMEHLVTSQLLEAATCFLRLQINLFLTSFF